MFKRGEQGSGGGIESYHSTDTISVPVGVNVDISLPFTPDYVILKTNKGAFNYHDVLLGSNKVFVLDYTGPYSYVRDMGASNAYIQSVSNNKIVYKNVSGSGITSIVDVYAEKRS